MKNNGILKIISVEAISKYGWSKSEINKWINQQKRERHPLILESKVDDFNKYLKDLEKLVI
jgi:hypothetical protein